MSRPPTSTRWAGSCPPRTGSALLAAARAAGAVVVEDDYDSEFRYDVAPVPALAGLDRAQVAYVGTAAKSVSPSLRLGWLVAPPRHARRGCRPPRRSPTQPPWPSSARC